MKISEIKSAVYEMAERAERKIRPVFDQIDRTAAQNTCRVMEAFQEHRVSEACFAGTTGYGYDDLGRETLDKIYAQILGAEAAIVRAQFVNGTHALVCAMFALADPGETILAVTGTPYDTLRTAIGIQGEAFGSLRYFGIDYRELSLNEQGRPDLPAIAAAAADPKVKGVMIQRSRGYADRPALRVADIRTIVDTVRAVNPSARIMVDNCYGEFIETEEPCHAGADLIAGSLIKNPGGGLAPCGGYVAGKAELVERAAQRLTTPGIGGECGATLGVNRTFFQGLFLAPHTVAQALKTVVFCAAMMEELGIDSSPRWDDARADIIQMVKLGSPDRMKQFCLGIQSGAPVDSYITPVPWAMPGYNDEVIMAAGAFVQGSSIELSADGPMREPYIAYLQGGLTYESGKLGVMMAVSAMMD